MMLSQLLGDVWRESAFLADGGITKNGIVMMDGVKVDEKSEMPSWVEGEIPDSKVQNLQQALEGRLSWHLEELDRRDSEVKKEIEDEEKDMGKKITSEDIREGWDKSSVAPKKEDPLAARPKRKKEKEKEETIELLNPGASVSSFSSDRFILTVR